MNEINVLIVLGSFAIFTYLISRYSNVLYAYRRKKDKIQLLKDLLYLYETALEETANKDSEEVMWYLDNRYMDSGVCKVIELKFNKEPSEEKWINKYLPNRQYFWGPTPNMINRHEDPADQYTSDEQKAQTIRQTLEYRIEILKTELYNTQ